MGRPNFDGVPGLLVDGLRKGAKDFSLLGVGREGSGLPPGELPAASRNLELGVLTRPEAERALVDELGRILSRWL